LLVKNPIIVYSLIDSLEEEYVTKLAEMQERHKQELAALQGDEAPESTCDEDTETPAEETPSQQQEEDPEKAARERKQAKVRRKREQQRQKQKELEAEQQKDLAGPSARNDELEILKTKLDPLSLEVVPVASDGHCLYRAVAAQCNDMDYTQMREYEMKIMRDLLEYRL
jgi:OTU domain-containing protein 6